MMKLLGFNNTWTSGWDLDHCNGRSGNSAAGDYVRKTQAKAITQWLINVQLPELSDETIKKLQKEMLHEYEIEIRKEMHKRVRNLVTSKADELMKNVSNEFNQLFENELMLEKIITGK